jgi:hypothetical protein
LHSQQWKETDVQHAVDFSGLQSCHEIAKSGVERPHGTSFDPEYILHATIVVSAGRNIHYGYPLERLRALSHHEPYQALLIGVGSRNTPSQDINLVSLKNGSFFPFPHGTQKLAVWSFGTSGR